MAEINEDGIIVSDNTLYVPQTWIDEVDECTPLSAENLNRMVLGMCNIAERCDSLSQVNVSSMTNGTIRCKRSGDSVYITLYSFKCPAAQAFSDIVIADLPDDMIPASNTSSAAMAQSGYPVILTARPNGTLTINPANHALSANEPVYGQVCFPVSV